jgi:hypothetical protein
MPTSRWRREAGFDDDTRKRFLCGVAPSLKVADGPFNET